jgi:peptide/nickel transport system ATP-binding protein
VASYRQGKQRNAVVHDVSLEVKAGECVALVGESGSGKTTLGRCIAGLHAPDAGTIAFEGSELASTAAERTSDERRSIQIIFQNPNRSLNPAQTIEQILDRPLSLFSPAAKGERQRELLRLLERVRLPAKSAQKYPRELSGGEKQRVAIARALAAGPKLLVCDEITSALDVSIQAAIVELLTELQDDRLALLFITHNLPLVNSLADRVVVIESGRVREIGPTASVLGAPQDSYTRRLLESAPDLALPMDGADQPSFRSAIP